MIQNTLRQWYTGLDIPPPLLRQDTPNIHSQSTPHHTNGWTCGLHMLLLNLTTIYQGRIPTLNHTQHHAETLSRSHLKYVLTEELDTCIACLVRELTNQAHRKVRSSHSRKKAHTKPTDTSRTNHITSPPTLTLLPCKRTHTHTQTHIPRPRTSPLLTLKHSTQIKKPIDNTQPNP